MAVTKESEKILKALARKRGRNVRAIKALGADPGGAMNSWERAFAEHLEARLQAGMITWYAFQPVNLRLPGSDHFYKPDFLAKGFGQDGGEGVTVFYEVKGWLRDKARNKIKTAAAYHQWAQFMVATMSRAGGFSFVAVKPDPRMPRMRDAQKV